MKPTKEQAAANWPKHVNGRNKRIGEMTRAEHDSVTSMAVRRLAPKFAADGVALVYAGEVGTGRVQ